jgi:cation diffusion facilitator family transporter
MSDADAAASRSEQEANEAELERWTSDRSVRRARRTSAATRRTVIIALVANALVGVTKLAGGALSGSASLYAEAAHSIADTTNQAFLLMSISVADRDPTPDQPFGYGRVRFLWTFIAALLMFLAGAFFAIGYGVFELIHGDHSAGYGFAYATLAIDGLAEGSSWIRALRQTRREAGEAELALLRYVRESRDPNVKMVLFEDTAALAGLALAAAGIAATQITGNHLWDAAGSIAIGVLLVGVAGLLGHDTSELLVGASARPLEREAIGSVLEQAPEVDRVIEILTMVLGPNSLMVAARLDFAAGLAEDDVERASGEIDERLRKAVPDITEVFLDATSAGRRRQVAR